MPALVYVALRYGAVLIVAIWLGATGTSWEGVLAFGLAMAALLAVTAKRRVVDIKISVPMAFLFELPGAGLATCIGRAIGAVTLRR